MGIAIIPILTRMNTVQLLIVSVSLSMDAVAASLCKGLSMKRCSFSTTFPIAFSFGFFQALMPLLGFGLGSLFGSFVEQVDHWIAFLLLASLGGISLYKSYTEKKSCSAKAPFKGEILLLSIATSIDAFVVGITFAILNINLFQSITMIGVITFTLCLPALYLGKTIGTRLADHAERLGGVLLIILGCNILFTHLF
jgi:putative Mn2+ efflux pump MntP